MKQFLGFGLIGVGAYLLYNMMQNGGLGVSSNGISLPGNTNTPNTVAIPLINKLLSAAGANANTTHDADTWSFYFATVSQSGSIPGDKFDAVFVIPFNGDRTKLYTASEFLAALSPTGLNGLGWGNPNEYAQAGRGFGGIRGNEMTMPFGWGNSPDASYFELNKSGFGN